MVHSAKVCPNCGAKLDYRLGEYECSDCTYSEKTRLITSQPQVNRPSTVQGYVSTPLPPAAEPPNMYGGLQPERLRSPFDDRLHLEKKYFIFLVILPETILLAAFIWLIGYMYQMFPSIGSSPQASEIGALSAIIIGLFALRLAIVFALFYGALFLQAIWLKWCCGGCSVFIVIIAFISFMFPFAEQEIREAGQPWIFLSWVENLLIAGLYSWFIAIMYRDIRNQQG